MSQGSPPAAAPSEAAPKPAFPFLDLRAQFATIREEVMAAVARVMESQQFILGTEVAAFEQEVRSHVGCQHVFGCASGSDALLLALMALHVGPGDEVIAPPFTFVATAGAIARLHARPVFIDIDSETYNLDPSRLEELITPRTKAIIPVHLFGMAAEMGAIMEIADAKGIPVLEDAAQAIGARYKGRPVGSIGAFGCFSFFPSKNLGCAGDGGMITTNDADLAAKLKILRVHGSPRKYEYEVVGINSRLDALQAAVLRVKLKYLDAWAAARQRNADRYRTLLAQHGLTDKVLAPHPQTDYVHVYNQFTVRTAWRDELKAHLQAHGIPTEIYYPYPLHLQPAFAHLGHRTGSFPASEAAASSVLSLPIYPELTETQQQQVVAAMAAFFGA